jgi:hypothetical protein
LTEVFLFLLFFFGNIKDWSNHHGGKVLEQEDRMEIKEWYQAMEIIQTRLVQFITPLK